VARRALDLGATLIVSSDSHSAQSFGVLDWGIRVAKRAWATSGNILNTRPLAELQKSLRRNRKGRPTR
jgi:DNA polymerase (family 10)